MDPLSIFDRAKSALAEIQISDVLKERLAFAIDKGAAAETKVSELRAEIADFKAELKIAQREAEEKKSELNTLREKHKEEIRVRSGVEFRKGERTGGAWEPFCPKCHIPIIIDTRQEFNPACPDEKCGWISPLEADAIHRP